MWSVKEKGTNVCLAWCQAGHRHFICICLIWSSWQLWNWYNDPHFTDEVKLVYPKSHNKKQSWCLSSKLMAFLVHWYTSLGAQTSGVPVWLLATCGEMFLQDFPPLNCYCSSFGGHFKQKTLMCSVNPESPISAKRDNRCPVQPTYHVYELFGFIRFTTNCTRAVFFWVSSA